MLAIGWHQYYYISSAPPVGEGMLAGGLPYINSPEKNSFRVNDYTYTPSQALEVDARVLAASHYYFDKMSRISPMDLVLGWRELSDEVVLNQISFSTANRTYEWSNPEGIISDEFIKTNTKLVHTIPENERIRQLLKSIRLGDVIFARGYIVNVKSASGLAWRTATHLNYNSRSTVRKATTAGDIFFITDLEVINPYSRLY